MGNYTAETTVISGGLSVLAQIEIPRSVDAHTVSLVNETLSGLSTKEGYALQEGDIILLPNQTNPVESGPWEASSGSWARPAAFPDGSFASGEGVLVTQGNYQGSMFYCVNAPNTDVVGTDGLAWAQATGPGAVNSPLVLTATNDAETPLTIRQHSASQSAVLSRWTNSDNSVTYASIGAQGNLHLAAPSGNYVTANDGSDDVFYVAHDGKAFFTDEVKVSTPTGFGFAGIRFASNTTQIWAGNAVGFSMSNQRTSLHLQTNVGAAASATQADHLFYNTDRAGNSGDGHGMRWRTGTGGTGGTGNYDGGSFYFEGGAPSGTGSYGSFVWEELNDIHMLDPTGSHTSFQVYGTTGAAEFHNGLANDNMAIGPADSRILDFSSNPYHIARGVSCGSSWQLIAQKQAVATVAGSFFTVFKTLQLDQNANIKCVNDYMLEITGYDPTTQNRPGNGLRFIAGPGGTGGDNDGADIEFWSGLGAGAGDDGDLLLNARSGFVKLISTGVEGVQFESFHTKLTSAGGSVTELRIENTSGSTVEGRLGIAGVAGWRHAVEGEVFLGRDTGGSDDLTPFVFSFNGSNNQQRWYKAFSQSLDIFQIWDWDETNKIFCIQSSGVPYADGGNTFSTQYGRASVGNAQTTVYGDSASATSSLATVIGKSATGATSTVSVGHSATGDQKSVSIGGFFSGAGTVAGANAVNVSGSSSGSTVGDDAVGVGYQLNIADDSIGFGYLATTSAAGQLQFGSTSRPITVVRFGNTADDTQITNALSFNRQTDWEEIAAPAVSVLGEGRIYFDSTAKKFKVSENNGAFVDLVSAAGGGDFSNGGELGTAARTLGNTDDFTMGFLSNNVSVITIDGDVAGSVIYIGEGDAVATPNEVTIWGTSSQAGQTNTPGASINYRAGTSTGDAKSFHKFWGSVNSTSGSSLQNTREIAALRLSGNDGQLAIGREAVTDTTYTDYELYLDNGDDEQRIVFGGTGSERGVLQCGSNFIWASPTSGSRFFSVSLGSSQGFRCVDGRLYVGHSGTTATTYLDVRGHATAYGSFRLRTSTSGDVSAPSVGTAWHVSTSSTATEKGLKFYTISSETINLDHNGYMGEFSVEGNSTVTTITAVNTWHGINAVGTGGAGTLRGGFTYIAPSNGSTTAAATAGGGTQTTFTSTGHGLQAGMMVVLSGHSNGTYNTRIKIDSVTTDTFTVTIAFVSDDSGDWQSGAKLLAGTQSEGNYDMIVDYSSASASTNKNFEFALEVDGVIQDKTLRERRFSNTDVGIGSGNGTCSIAAGDYVEFVLRCTSDSTNHTIKHCNVKISRI